MSQSRLRIGVVGAGMAGLTAAQILSDQGHDVVVLEKARGPGGRMSTRRYENLGFDHGAQYFTARDPRFLSRVMAWQQRGLVQPWVARIATIGDHVSGKKGQAAPRFVGVPGMSAICSELARGLADCRFAWAVRDLRQQQGGWILTSDKDQSLECDVLVLTTPPEQASILLGDPEVDKLISGVEMMPCWSLMLVLDKPLFAEHDAAFVNQGPLSWVASQTSRPQRPATNAWILHAGPEWSSAHLDKPADEVMDLLLDAARDLPLAQSFTVQSAVSHRWRYALARQPLDCETIWLGSKRLALAGDWCHGSRVEGAFLSGTAAAARIMSDLHPR
jgi:predicted NAD/FAD-dependent oxidoreductase